MPESYDEPERQANRFDVAKARYNEPEGAAARGNPHAEQEAWEAEQMRKSHGVQVGARRAWCVCRGCSRGRAVLVVAVVVTHAPIHPQTVAATDIARVPVLSTTHTTPRRHPSLHVRVWARMRTR